MYRRGLQVALSSLDGFAVVGEAADGMSVVELAARLSPDVVVMDLNMPGRNGIDATRLISALDPAPGVLILTMFDHDDSVFEAMRAGARGYIVKGASEEEIGRAIQAIAAGEAIFGPSVALRIIRYFGTGATPTPASVFPELTGREREILDLIAAGHNNPMIARRLDISPKTVRNNVSNIFSKLHVADRAEAIVRARRAGLGDAPST